MDLIVLLYSKQKQTILSYDVICVVDRLIYVLYDYCRYVINIGNGQKIPICTSEEREYVVSQTPHGVNIQFETSNNKADFLLYYEGMLLSLIVKTIPKIHTSISA